MPHPKEYKSSKLKYVVVIGHDLPIPTINSFWETVQATSPFTSLSPVQRGDFYNEENTGANEITISIIRHETQAQFTAYFQRLINFYRRNVDYNKIRGIDPL